MSPPSDSDGDIHGFVHGAPQLVGEGLHLFVDLSGRFDSHQRPRLTLWMHLHGLCFLRRHDISVEKGLPTSTPPSSVRCIYSLGTAVGSLLTPSVQRTILVLNLQKNVSSTTHGEPVSRNHVLRRERGQGTIHLPCSADHEQD